MAMSGGKDDGAPMMEINTTPLIDVMLVLLIMFIITIPVATNMVPIDLPAPSQANNPPPIDPVKNKLVLTNNGALLWNGTSINQSTLASTLKSTLNMKPEPELQFQPEEFAPYVEADRTLQTIKNSGVHKFGFVGNEAFANFGKAPADVNPSGGGD